MEIINTILLFLAAFTIGEIAAFFVFYFIRKALASDNKQTARSILKGWLERFIILLGLASSLPTILIFLGAIKLGTRLKEQQESKVSNDYFLIGNITSIATGILEFLLFKELMGY